MTDRWTDRLSEYLDGELAPEEVRELEAHLEGCAECREVAADLRRVTELAATLRDREPETELWAGISERIRKEPQEVRVVSLFDAKRARRRVSFSVPQLLAASIVLALVSAGSVWMALRGGAPGGAAGPVAMAPQVVTGAPGAGTAPVEPAGEDTSAGEGEQLLETAGTPGESVTQPQRADGSTGRAVSPRRGTADVPSRALPATGATGATARLAGFSDPAYDAAVADLEQVLEEGRDRLDPATVQVLEESLRTIDTAIEDARRALAADPANAQLNTYLAGTRQRKLNLLREASQIVTATT